MSSRECDPRDWQVSVSNPRGLSEVLNSKRDLAFLFRDLGTLRTDLPLFATVDDLLWKGPMTAFHRLADRLDKGEDFEDECSAFLSTVGIGSFSIYR